MLCKRCGQDEATNGNRCSLCASINNHHLRAKSYCVESTLTVSEVRRQIAAQSSRCYWCEELINDTGNRVIDHIVSMVDGGTNTACNIVISCWDCNARKGRADIYSWLKKIGRDSDELAWVLIKQHASIAINGKPKARPHANKNISPVADLQNQIQVLELELKRLELRKSGELGTRRFDEQIEDYTAKLIKVRQEKINLMSELMAKYPNQPKKWVA